MRWGSQQREPPLSCAPRHTLAEFKRLLNGPRHRPTPAAEHGQVVHRQIGSPIKMVQLKHTEANAWPAGPMARWRILLSITSATMGTYGGDLRNHPLQCAERSCSHRGVGRRQIPTGQAKGVLKGLGPLDHKQTFKQQICKRPSELASN